MQRVVDLEAFILANIVRPFAHHANYAEEEINSLWCNIDDFIVEAKLKPEWWELVIQRLSKIDFYFAYWLKNIPIVQFILSEIKRIKHLQNLGEAHEKGESIRICSAKTAEQICPENNPESPESGNSRGSLQT